MKIILHINKQFKDLPINENDYFIFHNNSYFLEKNVRYYIQYTTEDTIVIYDQKFKMDITLRKKNAIGFTCYKNTGELKFINVTSYAEVEV